MKRIAAAVLVLAIAATGTASAQVKARDGVYFAQNGDFGSSGWKDQVILEVKAGKITRATWNGVSNLPGAADKKSWAAAGKYGLKRSSRIGAEWDAQAASAEAWLVKNQNPGFNKFDKDGKTDAISGASITVNGFFALVNQALAGPPVAKGIYAKDGWYYQEQKDFDKSSGWKDTVLVTVVNGTVMDVLWNGVSKDTKKKSKLVEAREGRYGMAKAAKKGEWNVQAAAVQAAIVQVQDPAKIPLKADGTTDAISGASLHPLAVTLALEALKAAR